MGTCERQDQANLKKEFDEKTRHYTVTCEWCGRKFRLAFLPIWDAAGKLSVCPKPKPNETFTCDECYDHIYQCWGCGKEFDDRKDEPYVIPPSWNSSDGLYQEYCPKCTQKKFSFGPGHPVDLS